MNLKFAVLIFISFSCQPGNHVTHKLSLNHYDFVDSGKIGRGFILGVYSKDQHSVVIDVIQRSGNNLKLMQTIGPLDSQFGDTDPVFEDFNNDGLLDVKLKYGTGARGSNELFHLLVQTKDGPLNYIKGSAEIPNLTFDIGRHVITGTYYYAGTTFADFEIHNDSLVNISGVDVSGDGDWVYREHYRILSNGQRIVVRRDSIQDTGEGLYTRDP